MSQQTSERIYSKTPEVAAGGALPGGSVQSRSADTKRNAIFLFLGIVFGFTLIKGEISSWLRMQEMFRFESIHMYGILGLCVAIGMVSVEIIKRVQPHSLTGEKVVTKQGRFSKANMYGGAVFGIGWGITGLCPGPIFTNLGAGMVTAGVVLISALLGTYTYGVLQDKLPQ